MTLERIMRIVAGLSILLALAHLGGQADLTQQSWMWCTAFVGLNLFQSGFTNLCPLVAILKKLGFREVAACS